MKVKCFATNHIVRTTFKKKGEGGQKKKASSLRPRLRSRSLDGCSFVPKSFISVNALAHFCGLLLTREDNSEKLESTTFPRSEI